MQKRAVPWSILLLMLSVLTSCNLPSRQAQLKQDFHLAQQQTQARDIPNALHSIAEVAKSPELIRDDWYDSYPSYGEQPLQPGVDAVLTVYDNIATELGERADLKQATNVRRQQLEFIRRWNSLHATMPDSDWRTIGVTTAYADALAAQGRATYSQKLVDQAWQEIAPIVSKPQSVDFKIKSEFAFDAVPGVLACGPTMVEQCLKNIAAAYDATSAPVKAEDVRTKCKTFTADWNTAHATDAARAHAMWGNPRAGGFSRITGRLIKGSQPHGNLPPNRTQ